MVRPDPAALGPVVPVHPMLRVMSLDMPTMLALMTAVMDLAAMLFLVALAKNLRIAASFHDLAASSLLVVSPAAMLVVLARVMR